jgi:hypothetical protein
VPAVLAIVVGLGAVAPHAAAATMAAPDSAWQMRIVRTLADPKLEGRGVGTAGLEQAAAMVESWMKGLGLRPAGDDGGWSQWFEVTTGAEVATPTSLALRGRVLGAGRDFQPLGFSSSGSITAPVVFAGYGITAPGYDYDDYAGLDARGRIVLVLTNGPVSSGPCLPSSPGGGQPLRDPGRGRAPPAGRSARAGAHRFSTPLLQPGDERVAHDPGARPGPLPGGPLRRHGVPGLRHPVAPR